MAQSINVSVEINTGTGEITYKLGGVAKDYEVVAPFFKVKPEAIGNWVTLESGFYVEMLVSTNAFIGKNQSCAMKDKDGNNVHSYDISDPEGDYTDITWLSWDSVEHRVLDTVKGIISYNDGERYISGDGSDIVIDDDKKWSREDWVVLGTWVRDGSGTNYGSNPRTYDKQELQYKLNDYQWNEYLTYNHKTYKRTSISGGTATFTETTIAFKQISTNFKIFSGRLIGYDFLSSIQIIEKIDAEEVRVLINALDISKIETGHDKPILYDNEDSFDFDYKYKIDDVTTKTLSWSETNNLYHLVKDSSGHPDISKVFFQKHYLGGETIPADISDFSGGLLYDDDEGTVISFSELLSSGATISKAMYCAGKFTPLPKFIDLSVPVYFDIRLTVTYECFPTISTMIFDCDRPNYDIGKCVLRNYKNHFYPDEIIDYGDDAVIDIYNRGGEVIKTVPRNEFVDYISSQDEKYHKLARTITLVDGNVELRSEVFGRIPLIQIVAFTYDRQTLILDAEEMKTEYVIKPTFIDFDYTGLVAKVERHTNEVDEEPEIEEIDVTSSTTKTHRHIDPLSGEDDQIAVTISYTNEWGQVINGIVSITIVYYRVIKVTSVISGNSTKQIYWSTGEEFKLPISDTGTQNGLKFTKVYNDEDGTTEIMTDAEVQDELEFFRDAGFTKILQDGISWIVPTKGNDERIYYKLKDSEASGFYDTEEKEDVIDQVYFKSGITPTFYLGNRLDRFVPLTPITIHYWSGKTLDTTNYRFDNEDIVMEELTYLGIWIGTEHYDFEEEEIDKIVWEEPDPEIIIDTEDFQSDYNKATDKITADGLKVTMKYKYEYDSKEIYCDYEQECTYSSSSAAYNKFIGAGKTTDPVLGGYDLGEPLKDFTITASLPADGVLTFTALDRFTNNAVSGDVTVRIVQIVDILSITLIKAYTQYQYKDSFLNKKDTTEVSLTYKDSSGADPQVMIVKLNNNLSCLNVNPIKGTVLTQLGERNVIVTSSFNQNVRCDYMITVGAREIDSKTTIHYLVAVYFQNFECPDGVKRTKYFLVENYPIIAGGRSPIPVTEIMDGTRVMKPAYSINRHKDWVVGYIDDINDATLNGKVVMFYNYKSPISGSSNMIIKFPCYTEGNADLINKCHFGIMFGHNNDKNRLFLSGNPDYPNKDWHTEVVDASYTNDENMLTGNYGYFTDLSECVYGETDNKVMGYDIVSNNKLLVVKDHSDKETAIYFREPQLVAAMAGSEEVKGLDEETLYQEEYSVIKGNNANALINHKAICNFNGDSLFLDYSKSLVGLDLTGIVSDNQRYATSRSYYIDSDLATQDLTNAFVWTNNVHLFLVLDNKIYVTHYETKSSETKQYEWYVMDIPNVTSVMEKGKDIYLGTKDGKVYKFNDNFRDEEKIFAGYGVVKISVYDKVEAFVALEAVLKLEDDKTYYFKPVRIEDRESYDLDIYYSLGSIQNNTTSDCTFYVDNNDNRNVLKLVCRKGGKVDEEERKYVLKLITEGWYVYLNQIDNTTSKIECETGSIFEDCWGKKFKLKEYIDITSTTAHEDTMYKLLDENGDEMPVKELWRARLCIRLEKPTKMVDINKFNGSFKLQDEDRILDIVKYGSQRLLQSFSGEIIHYSNVEAFYITKPYVLGSLEYFKTIWSFTLTNDTRHPSEIEVCYASNKIPYEKMKTLAKISKEKFGFEMSSFNFQKVDFDKYNVPRTYTNKRIISQVKFICFAMRNYNDTNGVISSMSVTYSIPYPSYSGD